jgi:pimeloyl-[acyl-carrier protein] methyl ester esterase
MMTGEDQGELLVMLPGLDGTGRLFLPLQSALHLRGIESLAVTYPERLHETHDTLVADVIASIPSDRPIVLLGESFGASLALKLAKSEHLCVERVILCAPAWRSPPMLVRRVIGWALPILMRPPLLRLGLSIFGMNGASASARRDVVDVVAHCDWRLLRSRMDLLAGLDLRALAADLSRPALLIAPSSDRLVIGSVDTWRGSIVKIEGPHFILQAEPENCAEAIAAFLTPTGTTTSTAA